MKELDKIRLGFCNFCTTYAELAMNWDICEKLPDIPVAEPVCFAGISDGKRSDAVQASLYDSMMAEISAEKYARAEKFRKTHDICKKSKDDTPADRRRNKLYRLRKLYGNVWEDGREWYYENGKTGSKKSTEKDAEILRNLKVAELEKSAYAELMPDNTERHIGFNAVQRIMYNADKRMREIRAEKADPEGRCDDTTVETYDDYYVVITPEEESHHGYPYEYYNEQSTWKFYEYMIRKYGMEYANKYAKGEI